MGMWFTKAVLSKDSRYDKLAALFKNNGVCQLVLKNDIFLELDDWDGDNLLIYYNSSSPYKLNLNTLTNGEFLELEKCVGVECNRVGAEKAMRKAELFNLIIQSGGE